MSRGGDWPQIVRCKDGWIGLCIFTPQQWDDFADMIGRPTSSADDRLNSMGGRGRNRELARVGDPAVARAAHRGGDLRARRAVPRAGRVRRERARRARHVRTSASAACSSRTHCGSSSRRSPYHELAPVRRRWLGCAAAPLRRPGRPPARRGAPCSTSPRSGPGPAATHLLATLGADVVKVESPTRPDGMRFATTRPPTDPQWVEYSPTFHGTNPGKRSVTIDFSHPRRDASSCCGWWSTPTSSSRTSRRGSCRTSVSTTTCCAARRPDLVMLRMPAFGTRRAVARPQRVRADHRAGVGNRVAHRHPRDRPASPLDRRPDRRHPRCDRGAGRRSRDRRRTGRRAAARAADGRGRAERCGRADRHVVGLRHACSSARAIAGRTARRRACTRASATSNGSRVSILTDDALATRCAPCSANPRGRPRPSWRPVPAGVRTHDAIDGSLAAWFARARPRPHRRPLAGGRRARRRRSGTRTCRTRSRSSCRAASPSGSTIRSPDGSAIPAPACDRRSSTCATARLRRRSASTRARCSATTCLGLTDAALDELGVGGPVYRGTQPESIGRARCYAVRVEGRRELGRDRGELLAHRRAARATSSIAPNPAMSPAIACSIGPADLHRDAAVGRARADPDPVPQHACAAGRRRRARPSRGRAPIDHMSSTRSVTRRHDASRSKPSGRTTASPVGSTDVTRSTRNVRSPASVSATRYHARALGGEPERVHDACGRGTRHARRSPARPVRPRSPRAGGRRDAPASGARGPGRPTAGCRRPPRSTRLPRRRGTARARARTSLRSAALTSGVAVDAGPATRNSARASAALSPLRSVRAPPRRCHPPFRPWLRVDGDPGHAERLEVTTGGALRHLELRRPPRRR